MSCSLSKWELMPLEKLTKVITRGITPKYTEEIDNSAIVLNQRCIREGRVLLENARRNDLEKRKVSEIKALQNYDILINSTGVGTLGRVSQLGKIKGLATVDSHVTIVRADNNKVDEKYLGYAIKNKQVEIESMAEGSTGQTELNKSRLGKELFINYPYKIEEQKAIASILSGLDEKIETNRRINENLEQQAQALFKHWFVDFEFPNENGEPYKSNGGEMVESELGMIPKGWEVKCLGDIIELLDSKRIPLSKKEREIRENRYPYYGAASQMDYVDEYLFEGTHVLLGEDGTVVDEKGYPILQYVWGKFWVNNHAHVIKGKKTISENFIYLLLKNTSVSSAVTGAVQPKINQKNLKSLKVILPISECSIYEFSEKINSGFEKIKANVDEIKTLTKLRDTLLPKLMSGEIRVPLEDENIEDTDTGGIEID